MVKQGDIIWIDLNPQKGSEQAGRRPAVVVSNDQLNKWSKLSLVCPITNTHRNYPTHVVLDNSVCVTGEVMCEQIKAVDLSARTYTLAGTMPQNIMEEISATISFIVSV